MSKTIKVISDIIFYLGLTIAAVIFANRFTGWPGIQVLSVTSGSMEPSIKTGGVVLVKPDDNYMAGDIVTFSSGSKSTTTHRIVFKLWPNGVEGEPSFLTSGDANSTLDVTPITQDKIQGKVILTVPYLGYAAAQTKTPGGFILLVIVPGTIVIYEELRTVWREMRAAWLKKMAPKMAKPVHKAMVMLPIIAAVCVITTLTGAFFSDRATSTGNGFNIAEVYSETVSALATTQAEEVVPTPTNIPTPTPSPTPIAEPTPTEASDI